MQPLQGKFSLGKVKKQLPRSPLFEFWLFQVENFTPTLQWLRHLLPRRPHELQQVKFKKMQKKLKRNLGSNFMNCQVWSTQTETLSVVALHIKFFIWRSQLFRKGKISEFLFANSDIFILHQNCRCTTAYCNGVKWEIVFFRTIVVENCLLP